MLPGIFVRAHTRRSTSWAFIRKLFPFKRPWALPKIYIFCHYDVIYCNAFQTHFVHFYVKSLSQWPCIDGRVYRLYVLYGMSADTCNNFVYYDRRRVLCHIFPLSNEWVVNLFLLQYTTVLNKCSCFCHYLYHHYVVVLLYWCHR